MANDLQFEISSSTDQMRIKVRGEVDMATAPALHECLAFAMQVEERADIVVDLAAVSFMDSSGLSALISVHHGVVEAGNRLIVSNPSRIVARLLTLAGVDSVLDVRHDSPDAVAEG